MGWVTLDDGQKVYIGSGGKVLATRGAISSAAGGKERGRALAGRSKAAVGNMKVKGAARRAGRPANLISAQIAKQERERKPEKGWTLYEQRAEAAKQLQEARQRGSRGLEASEKTGHMMTRTVVATTSGKRLGDAKLQARFKQLGNAHDRAQQSPATTRAIEHARAAAGRPKTIADAKQTGREELIHGLHNWEPKTRTMQRFKDMGRKRKVAEEYIRDRLAEPTNRIVGGMLGGQRAGQAKVNAAGRKIAAAAEEARKARVAKWNYPH